ncbi:MAG: zf-HC2 domain-containing protein [Candidatus Zixiibacteriota bacterium]
MKHCSKYIQNIADYIDGEIDESLCADIEKHLKECHNCRLMVDTLKQTVVLCRDGKKEKLPPELEAKFSDLIRRRWEKKFGQNSTK